jgi:Holliday junction resolvasome RuvABC ATP-dependent DNA helicase subunit
MNSKKPSTRQIVKKITEIRVKNNRCWMALLALAVKAKPRLAKRILKQITDNDRSITQWMAKL